MQCFMHYFAPLHNYHSYNLLLPGVGGWGKEVVGVAMATGMMLPHIGVCIQRFPWVTHIPMQGNTGPVASATTDELPLPFDTHLFENSFSIHLQMDV